MKKVHAIFLFLLLVIISSCVTSVSQKQLLEIQQGMTQQDVKRILGTPDSWRFDGSVQEWEFYRSTGYFVGTNMAIIVKFIDGEVVGVNAFDESRRSTTVVTTTPSATTTIVSSTPNSLGSLNYRSSIGNGSNCRGNVMGSEDFGRFFDELKYKIRSDDQQKMVDEALLKHDFTSEQCSKVVKTITSSYTQLAVMKRMYPSIVDKDHFQKVIDNLFFASSKDQMREYIREYHTRNK